MEKDDEVKGEGNSYTTLFRQNDPRIGRWLSRDPVSAKYASLSPYNAFFNNPIYWTDPFGDDPPKRYSVGQRMKNFFTGKGYRNDANKYAVKNNIDEMFITETENSVTIEELSYSYEASIDDTGMTHYTGGLNVKETIYGKEAKFGGFGGGSSGGAGVSGAWVPDSEQSTLSQIENYDIPLGGVNSGPQGPSFGSGWVEPSINWKHILDGEIIGGSAKGKHSIWGTGTAEFKYKIHNEKIRGFGAYKARIRVLNSDGLLVLKNKTSTMFPDIWTPGLIQSAIINVFNTSELELTAIGPVKRGEFMDMKIILILDSSNFNRVKSAYPDYEY